MRLAILALTSLILAGCASPAHIEPEGYVGRPEAELLSGLGRPQRVITNSDGSRVLQYRHEDTAQFGGLPGKGAAARASERGEYAWRTGVPSPASTAASAAPPDRVPGCGPEFTVDAQGVVRSFSTQGRDCRLK
jgi:hypothetical protein